MVARKRTRSGNASAPADRTRRPAKDLRSLACRVDVSFNPRASGLGRVLNATTLPYAPAGESSFVVLANDAFARFTALSPTGDLVWTMVRTGADRGTAVWDHSRRTVFILDEVEVPRVSVSRPSTVAVRITRTRRGSSARLSIADDALGAVRHELRFRHDEELGRHGPALLKLLFGGPACHASSGFPFERLSTLGCLESAHVYIGDDTAAIVTVTVKDPRSQRSQPDDFAPPVGYEVVKPPPAAPEDDEPIGPPPADTRAPDVVPPPPLPELPVPAAAVQRQALSAEESFTPDCLGTTRHGSMAIVIHQDVLDHSRRALNAAASVLGVATIARELRIAWLRDLRAIRAGSATAAGTGLFCALEDTRVKATSSSPARGGLGYLDQLAVQALFEQTAREVGTGALLNSMRSWGITSTNLIAKVFAANGNLRDPSITEDERIDIADAFTNATYGTLAIGGLPYELETGVPGFFEARLWSLTGTMNFGSLGGAPLIPVADIGPSGNILLTIAIPATTVTATATWRLLPLSDVLLNAVTLVSCLLFPFSCAFAVPANLLLKQFLQTQLAVLTASTAGVTIGFDIRYAFDPSRGVVAPTVSVTSVAGRLSLLSTNARAPIAIVATLNIILAAVEQQLQAWLVALVAAVRALIETQLRNLGLECPLGATPLGLSAASGSAASTASSRLTLLAELRHDPATASHPYATQVPTAEQLARELETCHAVMRGDLLTPVPVPPFPPTPPPIGVYGGVTFSQNALNQYVDVHWRRRAFQWETSNPAEIQRFLRLVPANVFTRAVHRMHAWLAAPPRVELAEGGFVNLEPPLVVSFDDLRICFQGIGPADGDIPGTSSMLELSANARSRAAVVFDGLTPGLVFDLGSIEAADPRVWSVADPNNPSLAVSNVWLNFVLAVTSQLLRPWDAAGIVAPVAPPAWRQPIPATRPQRFFGVGGAGILGPQDGYFEVLGRRRALYMIPAVRSLFLELVDGSVAPTLNILVGNTPVPGMTFTPVTITSMTCAQGAGLRLPIGAGLVIPP
jgi:hypothetical protein